MSKQQSLQQFIESDKTQYTIQNGTHSSNEFIAIITSSLIRLSLGITAQDNTGKIPKKEHIKIIKKDNY